MKEKVIAIAILATIALVITVAYGIFVIATGDFMRDNGDYGWAGWFEMINMMTITITWGVFTQKALEVLEEDDES